MMQMVQGNLRRAIDAYVYHTGPGAGRCITLQTLKLPGPGTEPAGTIRVAHHGDATRQANLAGVCMAA